MHPTSVPSSMKPAFKQLDSCHVELLHSLLMLCIGGDTLLKLRTPSS